MKFVSDRAFANPDAAARKLMDLANAFEPVQDVRVYIEKINGPFLYQLKGTPAEYKAGLERAIVKVISKEISSRRVALVRFPPKLC
jgi:hypothetical protein